MRRIYYGSVTIEKRGDDGVMHITCIVGVTFAVTEDEAKGWAVSTAMQKVPGGKVSQFQMYQLPDDWVLGAAAILKGAA